MTGKDDQIRRKAYELWESQGKPDGRAEENWKEAARLIGEGATETPSAPRKRAPPKPKVVAAKAAEPAAPAKTSAPRRKPAAKEGRK